MNTNTHFWYHCFHCSTVGSFKCSFHAWIFWIFSTVCIFFKIWPQYRIVMQSRSFVTNVSVFWSPHLKIGMQKCIMCFMKCFSVFPGNCDNCGVWCGVYSSDLGGRMLLSLQRMERKTEICSQTLQYHRLENHLSCSPVLLNALNYDTMLGGYLRKCCGLH